MGMVMMMGGWDLKDLRDVGKCFYYADGLSLGNPGRVGGGGLISDAHGGWIKGFTRNIGVVTSVEAELWALRDGLALCLSLNILAVEIETNARVVFD
ncbi:hypothetical protein SO802_020054 [Lithocarpus litseifolius]|uniref:RNase H type-1 domain-containing protein n=1 Tax=Lithocarpus litseifolius TaxID=425828 RepID=A0AAW2CCH4_9ROSI